MKVKAVARIVESRKVFMAILPFVRGWHRRSTADVMAVLT
jgi:hypothetical protein